MKLYIKFNEDDISNTMILPLYFYSSTTHGPNNILSNSNIPKSSKNGTIIGSDPNSTSDVHGSVSTDGKSSSGKKGVLKHNQSIGQINSESTSETPTNKAKTQWSEHVWSK